MSNASPRSLRAVRWLLIAGVLAAVASAGAAWAEAREGVDVGGTSRFAKLIPADQIEREAGVQFNQLVGGAQQKGQLVPSSDPRVARLRAIAQRLLPHALPWNPRAKDWQWQVALIDQSALNAFCMPGGKIAFYTGIIDRLRLSDDEIAMIMGHEMAHALREHARERMGKGAATQVGARIGGAVLAGIFGIDPNLTDFAARQGASLLSLKFGREDESEADLVGLEIAARGGYDPRASVSLWQKMSAANKGAPPEWLSTHPSGKTRIHELEGNLPKVMPLYERALAQRSAPAPSANPRP